MNDELNRVLKDYRDVNWEIIDNGLPQGELRKAATDAGNRILAWSARRERDAVRAFIEQGWGPRCKTKDTEDFPELKDHLDGRCATCEMWEIYDEQLNQPEAKMFDPRDYGAKADGETDDTEAYFEAARAAKEVGGGTVYLPPGLVVDFEKLRSRRGARMNDLKPFVHGEEGTHSACDARLKAEGGKARCCYCRPHEGCEIGQKGDIRPDIIEEAGDISGDKG